MLDIYTVYDLIEKTKKLNKNQKIILLMLFIILILVIATSMLKANLKIDKESWDYSDVRKLESITEYINKDYLINNKVRYWELSNIIDKYIDTIINNSEYTYKDYYDVLTKEYKKQINREQYNKLAYDFIYKFIYESNNSTYEKVEYSVKDIYLYDDNMYLCYVSVDVDEMSDNEIGLYFKNDNEDIVVERKTAGYIGIKLNEKNETYSIFYLE